MPTKKTGIKKGPGRKKTPQKSAGKTPKEQPQVQQKLSDDLSGNKSGKEKNLAVEKTPKKSDVTLNEKLHFQQKTYGKMSKKGSASKDEPVLERTPNNSSVINASNKLLQVQQKSSKDFIWNKENNRDLLRSYFTAMKTSPDDYRKEFLQLFKEKHIDKRIEIKKLFDQKYDILHKAKNLTDAISDWLTEDEVKEIQMEVDSTHSAMELDLIINISEKFSETSESGLPKCKNDPETVKEGEEVVTGHQDFFPVQNQQICLSGPKIEEIANKHLLGDFPAVANFVKRLINNCPEVKKERKARRISLNENALKMAADRAKKGMLNEVVFHMQNLDDGDEDRLIYQKKLRKYAAPKIINFFKQCLAVRFILQTQNNLPSASPLDNNWKDLSIIFKKASKELQAIHHAWRCRKYRESISSERKRILSEKLKASEIFKDQKSNYPESVAIPFSGDAINLGNNPNWAKVKAKQETQIQLNFVENITKINRADGKEVQKVLVLSDSQLVILHPNSFNILYQINLLDVQKVSCTPHKDGLVVFHLNSQDKSNKALQKGDFVVNCSRIIELISKMALQYKILNNRELDIAVSEKFAATFKGKPMEFVVTNQNNSEKPVCRRKGNTINVGC